MSNAWQSYEERAKKPVVPEPGAYGAGLLLTAAILLAVVRRLTRRKQ